MTLRWLWFDSEIMPLCVTLTLQSELKSVCVKDVSPRRVFAVPHPLLPLFLFLCQGQLAIILFKCSCCTWFHFLYHTISFILFGLGTKIRCHPCKYKAWLFFEEQNQFYSLHLLPWSSWHCIHQAGMTPGHVLMPPTSAGSQHPSWTSHQTPELDPFGNNSCMNMP